jgi:signal transduction histidine kinase
LNQKQHNEQEKGLDLLLSYDVIKAHGGELRVETQEREGAEFIIRLPMKATN